MGGKRPLFLSAECVGSRSRACARRNRRHPDRRQHQRANVWNPGGATVALGSFAITPAAIVSPRRYAWFDGGSSTGTILHAARRRPPPKRPSARSGRNSSPSRSATIWKGSAACDTSVQLISPVVGRQRHDNLGTRFRPTFADRCAPQSTSNLPEQQRPGGCLRQPAVQPNVNKDRMARLRRESARCSYRSSLIGGRTVATGRISGAVQH